MIKVMRRAGICTAIQFAGNRSNWREVLRFMRRHEDGSDEDDIDPGDWLVWDPADEVIWRMRQEEFEKTYYSLPVARKAIRCEVALRKIADPVGPHLHYAEHPEFPGCGCYLTVAREALAGEEP
jgi:hypothetical protein